MNVVVVGGGLAGALVARALDQRGVDVVVIDAGTEPGGVTVPIRRDGYLLEPAAGTILLPHPHLDSLLSGLDVDLLPAGPAASRRFVRHRGRTIEVSGGPRLLTTPLVSIPARLRLLLEPLIRKGEDDDESLESFLVRRLGAEAGSLAAWLMAAGVHAGDPSFLSARAAFPQLASLEAHGSLFAGALAARRAASGRRARTHRVRDGIAGLARAAAHSLGDRWRAGWQAERLESRSDGGWVVHGPESLPADRVVAAVTPEALFPLMTRKLDPSGWDWAPVAVVWLGIVAPELPEAIGALVGPDEGSDTLGYLYESSFAPERAPAGRGLVKALVGGATRPGAVARSDGDLVASVAAGLADMLGTAPSVEMSHVVRHRPGIPQYTAARHRGVERLKEELPAGLEVAGWAYDGVGVSALATAAVRLADRLATH